MGSQFENDLRQLRFETVNAVRPAARFGFADPRDQDLASHPGRQGFAKVRELQRIPRVILAIVVVGGQVYRHGGDPPCWGLLVEWWPSHAL